MISDSLGPYHCGELEARDGWRGVLGFRWRPLWIITSLRLPNCGKLKLLSVGLFALRLQALV